jgi:hypothetical protein
MKPTMKPTMKTPTKETNATNQQTEGVLDDATCCLPKQFKGSFYSAQCGQIYVRTKCGDTPVLDIRGWGYLTGRGGGLALSEDEAVKIQDQFEKWVVAALNYFSDNEKHVHPLPGAETPKPNSPQTSGPPDNGAGSGLHDAACS